MSDFEQIAISKRTMAMSLQVDGRVPVSRFAGTTRRFSVANLRNEPLATCSALLPRSGLESATPNQPSATADNQHCDEDDHNIGDAHTPLLGAFRDSSGRAP